MLHWLAHDASFVTGAAGPVDFRLIAEWDTVPFTPPLPGS